MALARELPTLRASVLSPLAAASSERGVALSTRLGMAAYAIPVPAPATVVQTTISHRCAVNTIRPRKPTATTAAPRARVIFGPNRSESLADTGDSRSMATPLGSRHKPLTTIEE